MTHRVVVAGWGQVKQDATHPDAARGPLGLMGAASRRAAAAAGSPKLLAELDAVMVVRVMSRPLPEAARRLAERVGATPRLRHVSGIGGNSPQQLVNRAAGMIARGELESVLIAGAETYHSRGGDKPPGGDVLFSGFSGQPPRGDMVGVSPTEALHGIVLPVQGFPLFETALWAESGLERDAYLQRVGELWSRFSRVAARHPFAWLRQPRSAEAIVRPGGGNRRVAFPYTKFMTSMVFVDLGAAVILTSERLSRRMRPRGRRPVYFVAGAATVDRQPCPVHKTSFTASPPLEAAVSRALRRGRMDQEQIGAFDLYSCFPASVAIARRMIGLGDDDSRPLTVTGGLGFFGGPGNNYSLHAIATLADVISTGRHDSGMVTALGWFMHKHAVGVYGCRPSDASLDRHDREDDQAPPVGPPPEKVAEQAGGTGRIETYTVLYGRDGQPQEAILYGRTDRGERFVARTPRDADHYRSLTTRCRVGQRVRLTHLARDGRNRAEIV